MIKRTLLILSLPIILCGCVQKSSQEEIVFSSWGSVSEVKVIKNLISDFESENPEIKVRFMHVPQNYFQKIHLLFASNTAPDVIFINNLYLPIYENCLEDLSDVMNDKEFYSQAIEGLKYRGKLLAVPRDISNVLFYVNIDLLNKKGLSFPKDNWLIEELLYYLKMVSGDGVFGVSYEDDIYWALPYLNYFGGSVLSEDLKDVTIDLEQSLAGLNFYKALRTKYHVAPNKSDIGSSTAAQMFLDEKIVFYLSGRWMYPKICEKANFNWAVVPFPKGIKGVPCDTSGWAISKNSKHKEAALKFVKYLSSEKGSEYFTKTGLIVPARKKVTGLLDSDSHNEKVFIKIIETSEKTPVNKDYKRITDKINKTIEF